MTFDPSFVAFILLCIYIYKYAAITSVIFFFSKQLKLFPDKTVYLILDYYL